MKRQLLGSNSKADLKGFSIIKGPQQALSPQEVKTQLRNKRSPAYMDAMQKLDVGGHSPDPTSLKALIETVESELPGLSNLLLGIVAKCYLGAPFEVHTLQIMGDIIHHYKVGEPLPPELEKARSLAKQASYAHIEVYSDYIVTVDQNGRTSLIDTKAEEKTNG